MVKKSLSQVKIFFRKTACYLNGGPKPRFVPKEALLIQICLDKVNLQLHNDIYERKNLVYHLNRRI